MITNHSNIVLAIVLSVNTRGHVTCANTMTITHTLAAHGTSFMCVFILNS